MSANSDLAKIAKDLMADPRGLLAADESNKSAEKRFAALRIPSSPEMRRRYRHLLFTAPNFAQYISGVILYDETIRQKTNSGIKFTKYLRRQGIAVGIKVDKGLVPFTNFEPETITEGLDGLAERLDEYYKMGARFTKWRAAFQIDSKLRLPTAAAIHANLNQMARYACLVQSAGMVPIVEPEVLYEGNHSLETCEQVVSQVLRVLFDLLIAYRVDLKGVILKTSMVLAGHDSSRPSSPSDVAKATVRVLRQRVPKEVAGIVFLSGGQTPRQATEDLNAIARAGKEPWPISFSYSRAVQEPALSTWRGKKRNIAPAQIAFIERLALNSLARDGQL
ncbi:fructose-bisphosphate aldolase class I [Candidatus Saccharibacteria bacterium]|nr:fructose-bisphosphate aldolase class I [Candidatus Saccharibacteria bacterium]